MTVHPDVPSLLSALDPDEPVYLFRRHALIANAQALIAAFPGKLLYAVKCNDHPSVIRGLWDAGLRNYDTASLAEITLVRSLLPEAECHFMHPVKSRTAIDRALNQLDVKTLVVDDPQELARIRELAGIRRDLTIVVRMAVASKDAAHALDNKFGCGPKMAARLLDEIADRGWRTGISFHVGSQALKPKAWKPAFRQIEKALAATPVRPAVIDVGGGFPVAYRGIVPPPFAEYVDVIRAGMAGLDLPAETELWAEPGRALAAPSMSLLAKVEMRRGRGLFLNDGYYGSLGDLKLGYVKPSLRVHRPGGRVKGHDKPFTLYGPTCDSADALNADYLTMPAHIKAGDWIEFGQAGAYYLALRTRFNGFWADRVEEVGDDWPG